MFKTLFSMFSNFHFLLAYLPLFLVNNYLPPCRICRLTFLDSNNFS